MFNNIGLNPTTPDSPLTQFLNPQGMYKLNNWINYSTTSPNTYTSALGTAANAMATAQPKQQDQGFWQQFLSGIQQNITEKPIETIGGTLGGLGNIWLALENRRRYKEALGIDKEKYELQKQIALNNEQRNQEQWNMLKQQRASASL